MGDNALIQIYLQEIADLKAKLAASMRLPTRRTRSNNLSEDSDSGEEGGDNGVVSEKEKLAKLKEERLKVRLDSFCLFWKAEHCDEPLIVRSV